MWFMATGWVLVVDTKPVYVWVELFGALPEKAVAIKAVLDERRTMMMSMLMQLDCKRRLKGDQG
jgi:hypothetical protein